MLLLLEFEVCVRRLFERRGEKERGGCCGDDKDVEVSDDGT